MVQRQLFSSATDEWETPQELFDKLNNVFHFTLDVCANDDNHKCAKYFTREQDGLKQSWGGVLFGATHHMAERLAIG